METHQLILRNLKKVHSEISTACAIAERAPGSVQLVAVTKYAEPSWVQALIEAGHIDLGESRPQQLVQRSGEFSPDVHWHLIGHLQRNKVDLVLPATTLIHSVDSLRLLRKISQSAGDSATPARLLLEVNVSGEESKDGFSVPELQDGWPEILDVDDVVIEGLMTMAPRSDDPEQSRPFFRALCELRDQLVAASARDITLEQLSMGMSNDFAVAIEEGATIVRIGNRLFEGLQRAV